MRRAPNPTNPDTKKGAKRRQVAAVNILKKCMTPYDERSVGLLVSVGR